MGNGKPFFVDPVEEEFKDMRGRLSNNLPEPTVGKQKTVILRTYLIKKKNEPKSSYTVNNPSFFVNDTIARYRKEYGEEHFMKTYEWVYMNCGK
jgi:hypothetical protein